MKKLILFLLLPLWAISQTSTGQEQEFDYGIKNNSAQTITTPPYLTTTGMDGTQGKIPSALIAKTSDVADSLATKENVSNKSDSYTTSSSTAYVSGKALVDGLGTKQNTLTNPVTGTFVAGRVPYSSSDSTLTDSSKLLWNNTNSYFEVNGNAPRFTLKNNLNNFSTYFTNNANGTLFLKNHQDKTLAAFNNPVNSTEQPQMAIGNVSSIPTEPQLYVYGGMNGANIDARGSIDRDEANIDLEGNDWETSPNSLGFSYFGSNSTAFGTMMGYVKNKLGVIRFQDTNYAIINSEKVAGVSPIRFGINNIEIGNVNDKGFSYQSDFSSENISNPRWLADKGYVDTKAPVSGSGNYIQNQNAAAQSANMWISGSIKAGAATFSSTVTASNGTLIGGTLTSGYIPKATGANSLGNSLIYDNGNFVGIGTTTPNRKLEVADIDSQFSLKGTITGAPVYQTWHNSSNVRRGYFGFPSDSNGNLKLVNEESGDIYITPNNGFTIVSSTVTASPATLDTQLATLGQTRISPNLTGTPTAPTAPLGTNTTQIATTAFVQANSVSLSANNTFTGENTFSNYTIFGAPATLKNYTVATLPEGNKGDIAYVTDALAPTYLTSVVGGGSVVCPVFYNGTTWVSH